MRKSEILYREQQVIGGPWKSWNLILEFESPGKLILNCNVCNVPCHFQRFFQFSIVLEFTEKRLWKSWKSPRSRFIFTNANGWKPCTLNHTFLVTSYTRKYLTVGSRLVASLSTSCNNVVYEVTTRLSPNKFLNDRTIQTSIWKKWHVCWVMVESITTYT